MDLPIPWQRLPWPDAAFYDARVEVHHALQPAAAVGAALIAPETDLSHTSFSWSATLGALVGQRTPDGLRAGLALADLRLILVDDEARVRRELDLVGRTRDEAYRWLASALRELHGAPLARAPQVPSHELPAHPTAEGAAFADRAHYPALARWYANADRALRRIAARQAGASPVRCWPHHFDIATLIALDDADDREVARSIGVGMTPGDAGTPEPYWYVTPWPYPASPTLPPLAAGGSWATDGWLGALLPASAMTMDDAAGQRRQVDGFLEAGVAACRALLDD